MSDKDVAVEQENEVVDPQAELSEEDQAIARLKEAISVEREEIGPLRLKLTVTVPADLLDERRGEQFAELKRDASIPGFRKGHAPLPLIEKRFAGDVGEQLKSQLISNGYLAAVEKEEIKPLGDPLFWAKVTEERVGDDEKPHMVETEKLLPVQEAIEQMSLPKEGALTFSCELELTPEFELPELEKIPVKRPKVSIGKEDVATEVNRLRMMRGNFEPVDKGTIKVDDMLYADMKMTVDGDVIATEENFDLAARDLRIKGVPLVGFGDAAKGKKLNATVTFEATVPDDHENIDIRGKTAHFEFAVHEVKRLSLPELDQEFLSSLGFESKKDLEDTLRGSLESRLESTINESMQEQIGAYLLEKTKLDIPEGLSQRQTDRSLARRRISMYQAGVPESEIEKQMDALQAQAHDQSVRDLKLFFILEKIAEVREVNVSEEQLNAAIAQIAQQSQKRFDRVRDELSKGNGLSTLYLQLRDQRVLEGLLAEAEVTETEGPKTRKPAAEAKEETAKKATTKKTAKKKTTKKTS